MAERRCGLVYDERMLAHRNLGGPSGTASELPWLHIPPFERPERLTVVMDVLEGAGVLAAVERVAARPAVRGELALAHDAAYLDRLEAEAARAGREPVLFGHEAYLVDGSLPAALLGVGGLLEAVDRVVAGTLDTAYVLARPPGHHAKADAGMGFCLLNAVVIAARHAQRAHALQRVAVVDWDVHHGNGSEAILLDDPSVLFVSIHQDGLYPADTGGLEVRGAGGANVNVPLPDGCGDAAYAAAFAEVVVPVLDDFAPELVLISAGQDAAASDPLGRMAVTVPGFEHLAQTLLDVADRHCGGRLVAFHEGGYDLLHAATATVAIVEVLAGLAPTFAVDPIGCDVPSGVGEAAAAAIARARATHVGEAA